MQSKLQELTEKIYKEGVTKGNTEAQHIIEYANSEADSIITNAKKEAENILANAKKKALETKNNTESEIKLLSKQAINALKQQITDVLNTKIVDPSVKTAFNDIEFIKRMIETTFSNWSKTGHSMDINLLLPEKDKKELDSSFAKSVKNILEKGFEVKYDTSVKSGFQIKPKDGSYKLSFTDQDFINFFKQYMRPKLVNILFSEEEL